MATINVNNTYYMFNVTAANATAAATYTNNGVTYYVKKTIAGGTKLYVAAASGSVTSGTTLTKTSGVGDATITFSTVEQKAHINGITTTTGGTTNYTAGDTILYGSGATLVIDETPGVIPGPLTSSGTSSLAISNTSTTTPIVLTLNTENSDISLTYLQNSLVIRGDWIVVKTGDGTGGQTIDFSNIGGVSIDYPPCVWVETGDTRHKQLTVGGTPGYFMPFFNVGVGNGSNASPDFDLQNVKILNEFYGDLDHGPVFQFDASTKLATFGKGGQCSVVLGGTGMSAGTHSGTTVTITVGTGHGVVAHNAITVSGVTGAGAACYNGTYDVTSVTATTILYSCTAAAAAADPGNTAATGGAVSAPLGGAVIPNGARVIYPNIHITSTVNNTTVTSKNQIITQVGANWDIDVVAFSRNWYFGGTGVTTGAGDITISNMGAVGLVYMGSIVGATTVNNLAVAPDQSQAITTAATFQTYYCLGQVNIDFLWTLIKTTANQSPSINFGYTGSLASVGTVWSWVRVGNTSGGATFRMVNMQGPANAPLTVGPIYGIGGWSQVNAVSNIYLNEFNFSDQTTAVSSTFNSNLFQMTSALNVFCGKIRKLTNGTAPRAAITAFDSACYQCGVNDVVFDSQVNSNAMLSGGGERIYLSNFNMSNLRISPLGTQSTIRDCRYSSMASNTNIVAVGEANGAFLEWVSGTTANYTSAATYDAEPVQPVWTNGTKTTGMLRLGPVSLDKNMSHVTTVSGTYGTDWYTTSNFTHYLGNGVEFQLVNKWPIRGVTDFTGATFASTAHANWLTNAAFEFSMRNNDDTSAWGSWYDATTAANWQTALAAISGYDSNLGFYIRLRFTTSASATTRYFQYASITCTPDSTWVPAEASFVPIAVSGLVADSCVKLYDRKTGSDVRVICKIETGTSDTLDLPYDSDGTARDFKLKVRKSGYAESVLTGSSYQKGSSVPVSQIQHYAVVDATAAAITGISVNTGTNTVTVSSNRSITELYQYLQWWGAQVANIESDIPLVAGGVASTNYISTYNWVVNTGVALTGTGNIDLGSNTLTMSGTASSTFDWAYSTTKTWTRISVSGLVANSRVYINNTTDNVSLYNAVVAGTSVSVEGEYTAVKALELRVTNVSGVTAYLPYSAIGSFTSSGAAFTTSQELDTIYNSNAINGSLVTYFSTDYPNLQVDIASGTSFTVQELYAWYQYATHDAQGIVYYFGGITAQDEVNYLINTSIIDLDLDNTSGHNITMVGGYVQKDDHTSYIYATTANSIIPIYDRAYVADSTQIKNMTNLIPALL